MILEATGGFEPPNRGFADLRLSHLATPPMGYSVNLFMREQNGAGHGIRTRDFDLGKVALYH